MSLSASTARLSLSDDTSKPSSGHVSIHHLAHLPEHCVAHIALFTEVTNAPDLRRRLLAGDSDYEYAFIDAGMICSCVHLLAAIFRAVLDAQCGRLRTHNVHAEIVFALGPTNNIADAFRRFGMGDTTRQVLMVKIASDDNPIVGQRMQELCLGQLGVFEDSSLKELMRLPDIRKAYKLGPGPKSSSHSSNVAQQELETAILSAIALRGWT